MTSTAAPKTPKRKTPGRLADHPCIFCRCSIWTHYSNDFLQPTFSGCSKKLSEKTADCEERVQQSVINTIIQISNKFAN